MEMIKKQGESDRTTCPLRGGSLAAHAAAWLAARASDVYLVGGTIRDWLLGQESHDVDFAVAQDSLALARGLADVLGGYFVPLDRRRGIARVVCGEGQETTYVDLTLLQGETLLQDLLCRDFTINAMALRLGEEAPHLIDPHNGREDLKRRLIRGVTPDIFADDPLRLLRAVRLAAELEFAIEPQTEALLRHHAPLIGLSAAERIRYELVKVLRTSQAPRWIHFLADTALLACILPQLEPHLGIAPRAFRAMHELITGLKGGKSGLLGLLAEDLLARLAQPTNGERRREDVLRMAALLFPLPADEVRTAFLELRFSGREARCGRDIVAHCQEIRQRRGWEISRRATYRFFREAGEAGVDALLLALAQEGEGQKRRELAEGAAELLGAYFHCYSEVIAPMPLLDGHTVMSELGLEPGPEVGEFLAVLREAQAVGEVHTPEEALAFVRSLLCARRSTTHQRSAPSE
jgi:tRNA nucleotidyltransferase/poly(A) polymerase